MSKVRYKFNTKSLTYEKARLTFKERFWRFLSYIGTGLVFATITILLSRQLLPSPSEKKKNRELEAVLLQYDLLENKMAKIEQVLKDLEDRDDNIYRTIFEAEPLPKSIRYAGSGGSEKYSAFDSYDNSDLLKNTTERVDRIAKQLYIQSKSFDEVMQLAQGYGNHVVVNHGFGYQTLYGHMSRIAAKVGQKVTRGQLIGYVGSTGLSTAPHVHYEVIKNQEKVNPINFYFNDLSPEQYQLMVELSKKASQSFD